MSTWIVEEKRTWPEWVALKVLKVGPIPSHLALIMDGNRRFAKLQQQGALHGHLEGFKTLTNVLAWCRDLGITQVTAYAFSIENFKRSKEEVDGLMSMAAQKFEQMLNEKDKLFKHGVRIRIIGNLDMLPLRLRCLAAEAMLLTKDNNRCFLNLAMAYTSRDEMTAAVKECAAAIAEGTLKESDVTPRLLEYCLYTSECCHPDLLVRTSGETRLSDFLLWQTQFSCLFFAKVLWPELSIWHVFGAVFHYQRYHHMMVSARKQAQQQYDQFEHRADLALCQVAEEGGITQEHLSAASEARQERITKFKDYISWRRLRHLQDLSSQLKQLRLADQAEAEHDKDAPDGCSGVCEAGGAVFSAADAAALCGDRDEALATEARGADGTCGQLSDGDRDMKRSITNIRKLEQHMFKVHCKV